MSDFKAKMHQIRLWRPLGELTVLCQIPEVVVKGACCPLPKNPIPDLDPSSLDPVVLAFFFPNLGMSAPLKKLCLQSRIKYILDAHKCHKVK